MAAKPIYTDGVTTTFALASRVQGLPEIVYTSEGNAYLHLPGVIMAESTANEVRYLLSDGLGSVRQVVDESERWWRIRSLIPTATPFLILHS